MKRFLLFSLFGIMFLMGTQAVSAGIFVYEDFENNSLVNWNGGSINSTNPANGTYSLKISTAGTIITRNTGGVGNNSETNNITFAFSRSGGMAGDWSYFVVFPNQQTSFSAARLALVQYGGDDSCASASGLWCYENEAGTMTSTGLYCNQGNVCNLTIEINTTASGSTGDTTFNLHMNGTKAGPFNTKGSTPAKGLYWFGGATSSVSGPVQLVDDIRIYNTTIVTPPAATPFIYNTSAFIFPNSTIELKNFIMNLNLTFNTTAVNSMNATLVYNGTNMQPVCVRANDYVNCTATPYPTLRRPQVSAEQNNNTELNFYWLVNISYVNGSSEKNQVYNGDHTILYGYNISNTTTIYINGTVTMLIGQYYNDGNATLTFNISNSTNLIPLSANSTNFFGTYPTNLVSLVRSWLASYNMTIRADGIERNMSQTNDIRYTNMVNFSAVRRDTGANIPNITVVIESMNFSQIFSFDTDENVNRANLSFVQGNYRFSMHAPGFASIKNISVNINASSLFSRYQFSFYTINSFNLTFKDEQNGTILYGGPQEDFIQVEFVSDIIAYNFSINGSGYVDLLTPTDYSIRYKRTAYGRLRTYLYTLTNGTTNNLEFFMIRSKKSNIITTTVIDGSTLNRVEGAVVYIQRRFQNNSYITVAMGQTDPVGRYTFDVEFINESYRINVDSPWKSQRFSSAPFFITSNTINLYINTQASVGESYFNIAIPITYSIDYLTTSSSMQASYTDSAAQGSQYCFYIKQYTQYRVDTINQSCSTASSGVIIIPNLASNTTTYYGVLTTTISGTEKLIGTGWYKLPGNELGTKQLGLLMSAGIVTTMALSTVHPLTATFSVVGLVFTRILGILEIPWPYIIGMVILTIALTVFISMKVRQ